ncbi:MAG: glucoamylase family protein [Methylococcaceae bacterium]
MPNHLFFFAWLLAMSAVDAHDLGAYVPEVHKNVVLVDFGPDGFNHWGVLPGTERFVRVVSGESDPEHHPGAHLTYEINTSSAALPEGGYGLKRDLSDVNASGYDHLVFWVKRDVTETPHSELELRFERPDPALPGKLIVGRYRLGGVTTEWKRMVIPLNQFIGLDQWEHLTAVSLTVAVDAGQVRTGGFSVGNISLIQTGQAGPGRNDPLIPEQRTAWATALGSEQNVMNAIRNRMLGWPNRFLTEANALPRDDQAFLLRVATDTWRGVAALVDGRHGLPIDRIQLASDTLEPGRAAIGDYTNISTVGLYVLGVLSAHELGFISRAEAVQKLTTTLTTLDSLETWKGFFYNYYNTTTLERTSHFVSFVDSAWLSAGLMVIRQAYPELAPRCTRLLEAMDYRHFYDAETRLMTHGQHVNMGQRSNMHYGVMYAESRLGSIIAMSKGDIPSEHWFNLVRTFPAEQTWQSQLPLDRTEHTGGGYHWMGGYYQWRDFRYVPSWGGSLFEALMPGLILDEQHYAPHGLGYNNRIHTTVHRLYALEELNYPVWGMSPSSTPGRMAHYDEYGIKALGLAGYASGVVTPHVSALALMTEPTEAIANLKTLTERYPVYGDFGFYDAVNPATGEVSYSYLSLDQTMTLIALTNYLKDHAVQKYFAQDSAIQSILPLLAIERLEPE